MPLAFVEAARRCPLDPHQLGYHHDQDLAYPHDSVPAGHTVVDVASHRVA